MNIIEKLIEGLSFYIDAVEKVTHGYNEYFMNDYRLCIIGRHNQFEMNDWQNHQSQMLSSFILRSMPKYDRNNKMIYYFDGSDKHEFLELEWMVIQLFTDYVCDVNEENDEFDYMELSISKKEWLKKAKSVLTYLKNY